MPAPTLSDFICANLEPILDEWESFAREAASGRQLDPLAARDHAREIALAIAADLHEAPPPEERAEKSKGRGTQRTRSAPARLHRLEREASGFSIAEEIAEFQALRSSIVRLWCATFAPEMQSDAFEELLRFNEAIDEALSASVAAFSAEKEQHFHHFNALLTSSPDLHYLYDRDGRYLYANESLAHCYDAPVSEVIGKTMFELGSPFAAQLQAQLDQVMATGQMCRGDVSHVYPDGSEATYESILVPVKDDEGVVEAVAGTGRNMSHRKQLEKDLLREKTISDSIIESAPGGFFLLDEESRLVRWNRYVREETGLSDEELSGFPILSAIHEDDQALAAAKVLTAFATGYARMEVRIPTHDHQIKHYLKTMRAFTLDGVPYLSGFGIDITERKLAEEALAREKAFSDELIESVPGAFYVVNREGDHVRWNSVLKRLTGLSDPELLKRPSLLNLHAEDRPLAATTMNEAFAQGSAHAELRILTVEHGIRPFFLTARRFEVDDIAYMVGVGIDITEWQARLQALEQEAWTDPLTRIANRGHFLEMAAEEFARCRRYGHPLSVWMLDIDHFKVVNDTFGHRVGDTVLQALVATCRLTLRDWDILGRMGGEEFAVLLPETETGKALQVAERLRQALTSSVALPEDKDVTQVTVSIGIATAQPEDSDIAAVLERADHALYAAKRNGRDRVCVEKR